MLDVLYDRDGGRRPEAIVTDTASYSDIAPTGPHRGTVRAR
ncbi:hypothetical protein AB0C93_29050 [Streptomyces sp. NPDC048518]